jgi:hypothetical protein
MRVLELRYYLGVEARDGTDAELQRVASDPAFGEALLREGIDTMLAGDVDTGKGDPARLHQGDGRLREAW